MKTHCDDCCSPQVVDAEACACCEGGEILTPLTHYNRPGLTEISYRIGTHGDFLQTMIARLTGFYFDQKDEQGVSRRTYPLKALTTRNADDPSLALLDAWSMVADVLTFYQQRIANEGYLRTATERRSVLELSRLVGYKPRPGVAASVMLAYSLDDNFTAEAIIPAGSRVQSIPGPDELPQAFESSEEIKARAQWNNLQPRMSQTQTEATINSASGPRVYLKGISTNLNLNDPLLIDFGNGTPQFFRVLMVELDPLNDRTLITLQTSENFKEEPQELLDTVQLINALTLPSSRQPKNTLRLDRKLSDQFAPNAGNSFQVLSSFSPQLHTTLTSAVANAQVAPESSLKVYALRVQASLFGHNSLKEATYDNSGEFTPCHLLRQESWTEWNVLDELENTLHLDRVYDQILPGSYIVVDTLDEGPKLFQSNSVKAVSRNTYGVSGETTTIELENNWWNLTPVPPAESVDISKIRTTKIYAQPEQLELTEEPINNPVCGGVEDKLELDGFYEGLESGRWVIVSGEREIAATSGVRYSELAMLSSVTQHIKSDTISVSSPSTGFIKIPRAGEKTHTFITLANELAYCFKRDTVTIYGNVVKATHGETRHETLGSGDGAKVFQAFELKQFPLTHISVANPNGIDSSLKLYVNNLRWHESDSLAGLQANARQFITKTDNEDKTRVIFGNGKKGARLPTGTENIRTEYRNGIGQSGNVSAEQISLLMSKPLGVKEVINPLRASGGADRETRDQARKHVPLAVKALDRLVSVKDYEDFSRIYAGIGKAHAIELSNGRQQLVYVTVAGANDIAIDEQSDLFRNLYQSLHDFGDPYQQIQLAIRELMLIVFDASIAILPDYQWEPVVTEVRERLLQVFSFAQRELGQDVVLSEIISVIQTVSGVAYVDVNAFGGIPEKRDLTANEIEWLTDDGEKPLLNSRQFLTPDEIVEQVSLIDQRQGASGSQFSPPITGTPVEQRLIVNLPQYESKYTFDNKAIRPAQIAFMSPEVPATLLLNQIVRQP